MKAPAPLFALGRIVMTPGVQAHFGDNYAGIVALISRHVHGDWSELDAHDRRMNEAAVREGTDRVLSLYVVDGERFYVITEWDRSSTCVLLASEY